MQASDPALEPEEADDRVEVSRCRASEKDSRVRPGAPGRCPVHHRAA